MSAVADEYDNLFDGDKNDDGIKNVTNPCCTNDINTRAICKCYIIFVIIATLMLIGIVIWRFIVKNAKKIKEFKRHGHDLLDRIGDDL